MQNADWEHMPYFLATARAGSFRGAADEMRASHGTIIRHVEALEAAYGALLFQRTRSGPRLTKAGQKLLPLAEQAEVVFRRARLQATGADDKQSGTVRISLTGVMGYEIVAPILGRFSQAYPEINLDVNVSDSLANINALQADVSLRYAHSITEDVVARKLLTMSLGVFASRDYIAEKLPEAGPNGEGLTWIGWDKTDPKPDWVADTQFPGAQVRHATTDHVMQIALARAGAGMVSTSPYFSQRFNDLIQVPGTKLVPDRSLWLLLHQDLRQTARVRSLVEFLAVEVRKMKPLLT